MKKFETLALPLRCSGLPYVAVSDELGVVDGQSSPHAERLIQFYRANDKQALAETMAAVLKSLHVNRLTNTCPGSESCQ